MAVTYKIRKLSYTEWLERVDEFLLFTVGKTTSSFNGIFWMKLYDVGCTAGEVVEALADELCKVEQEEAMAVAVVSN